ncbi:hypothetical protein AUEXF2481DRAFT_36408 [Aureobasidium subglaciale EXF-2481]|uniref:Uncharacterized protein n=1 Tax=Aureobasidium subglaciale (strain EXF-2481) TaxID=1043005 RepID=A0A074ZL37_AURSE|nr:uncharacterized protein AUEXF2481DRAFT_36408 [Aureobasidium subglaciale EXF-2481]KAI5207713.1 hypothetical protein E4T38_03178 [Aureobasidium subglaciale]KAI5226492.1 hypothetical protein E4T40_02952 [Aureobasidium subglaciale]KAI5229864.1 hypothetical protein E4T41_03175 [Aureobasidium subglaciale]KAI5264364.1 hypothetical protein E4T46_02953 [Aureobasidium subglaciale]KEQ99111.1 hypothetical protein AUEXF2481DRAFT_36408 [Aureobasidium subglaciale EXF-2481]
MARIGNITLDPAGPPKGPAVDTVKVVKTDQLPVSKPVPEEDQSEEDDIMFISDAKMKIVEPKKTVEPKKLAKHQDAITLKKPAGSVQPPESVRDPTGKEPGSGSAQAPKTPRNQVQKKPAVKSVKSAQAPKTPGNVTQKKPAVESATVSKPPVSEMDAAEIEREVGLNELVKQKLNEVEEKTRDMEKVLAEEYTALLDRGWEIKAGKIVSTISVADVESKAFLFDIDSRDTTDCTRRIQLRLRGLALVANTHVSEGTKFASEVAHYLGPQRYRTVFGTELPECIPPDSDSDDEGAELTSSEKDDLENAMSHENMDETENVQTSIELDEEKGKVSDEDEIEVDKVVQISDESDEDKGEVSDDDDNQ